MKNVVIDGATSFIACSLIEQLLKDNYNIFAVIRKNSSNRSKLDKYPNVHIIELNMEDIANLPSMILEKCDIYFHFAWEGTRGESRNNILMQEKNIEASKKTLIVAKELGCKKFFSAGSQAEYGLCNNTVSELTKCNPVTEYGKAKLYFYNYALEYCHNNDIVFIEPRFFSLYGPGDFEGTLIISTLKKMLNNEDVDLTEAKQKWNYLYINDAIKALVGLIKNEVEPGAYNIGSNDTRELKSFILEMKKISNTNSKLNFGAITTREIVNVDPDITKLKSAIDFQEDYSFEDGIKETIKIHPRR